MANLTIRDNSGFVQEELVFDRWHNTKWIYSYEKRVNGILQEEEYISKIVVEYKKYADDSNGKRYFLEASKLTKEVILEDLLPTLSPEDQQTMSQIIYNDFRADTDVLRVIFGIDAALEVQ